MKARFSRICLFGIAGCFLTGADSASADKTSPLMVVFSPDGNRPSYATWTGTTWGSSTPMSSIDETAHFMVLRNSPTRDAWVLLVQDHKRRVNVMFHDGQSWSPPSELCLETGQHRDRAIDAAYEQLSGECLMVYYDEPEGTIGYHTHDGESLSGEYDLTLPGGDKCDYLTLYPQPGSDSIILLAIHSEQPKTGLTTGQLSAAVWNGSQWSAWRTLEHDLEAVDDECYSFVFQGMSGDGLVAYAHKGSSRTRYRTWTNADWSTEYAMQATGAAARWIRLEGDRLSDQVVFAALDAGGRITANAWTGSSWGTPVAVADDAPNVKLRSFDIAFGAKGHALLVYGRRSQSRLRYRVWDGSSWSAERVGSDISRQIRIIQLRPGAKPREIIIAVSHEGRGLDALLWDGTSMRAARQLAPKLHGGPEYEPFMIAGPSQNTRFRLRGWREVPNPDRAGP